MEITAEIFKQATGSDPIQDDLERCNCKQIGSFGHWQCGWCTDHNKPRFMCGCLFKPRMVDKQGGGIYS